MLATVPQGDVNRPELHGVVPRAVRHLGEGIAKDTSGALRFRLGAACPAAARAQRASVERRAELGGLPCRGACGALAGAPPELVMRGRRWCDAAHAAGATYDLKTSVVEIYCERIRDLLDPSQENLQVKQDSCRGIVIEGRRRARCDDGGRAAAAVC